MASASWAVLVDVDPQGSTGRDPARLVGPAGHADRSGRGQGGDRAGGDEEAQRGASVGGAADPAGGQEGRQPAAGGPGRRDPGHHAEQPDRQLARGQSDQRRAGEHHPVGVGAAAAAVDRDHRGHEDQHAAEGGRGRGGSGPGRDADLVGQRLRARRRHAGEHAEQSDGHDGADRRRGGAGQGDLGSIEPAPGGQPGAGHAEPDAGHRPSQDRRQRLGEHEHHQPGAVHAAQPSQSDLLTPGHGELVPGGRDGEGADDRQRQHQPR